MLKKIFFKLLGERKKDYIRVILSGIFCISVVFFSTSVGSSLVYISTGRRATMTELVMEVEKNFILPYVLLIFLMILIILGYIRKRSSDYAMLNILGIKKKHRYMYIGCEYLGIIFRINCRRIDSWNIGSNDRKKDTGKYFSKLCKQHIFGNITVNSHTNYQRNHVWNRLRLL